MIAAGNIDDLKSNVMNIPDSETATSLRIFSGSEKLVNQNISNDQKLPVSLSKSRKNLSYSDSRKAEVDAAVYLQNFFLSNRDEVQQELAESDGFTVVKSGFRPAPEASNILSRSGLSDFYKFQVKEKKLQDWRAEKSRKAAAESEVAAMTKRRRFQLEYKMFTNQTLIKL